MILHFKIRLCSTASKSKACAKNVGNIKVSYIIIKNIFEELGSVKF
jgi:hypothetical protein